jgi:hypothetical protein
MKFAKLFDIDGHQVLAYIGRNDDGNPCMDILSDVDDDGVTVKVSPSWYDDDDGWDAAAKSLADMDEAAARRWRDAILTIARGDAAMAIPI